MADNLASKEYTPQELKGRDFAFAVIDTFGFSLDRIEIAKLGQLLNASHKSLKEDYEVTGIELDTFIENVQNAYVKAIGYKAGFFVCETGDGVSLL